MSIRVMTLIWDTCLYQSGTLNVLLAMADHASDNGRDIYPGIEYLAAKCRQTSRATQDCIKRLRGDKVVVLLGKKGEDLEPTANPIGGRGNRTEYRIDLERVKKLQALHQEEEPSCKHCEAGRKTPQDGAEKGELGRKKGELSGAHIDNRQEPSLNHSLAPAGASGSENIASLGKGSPERWPEFRKAVADTWPSGFPADNEVACRSEFDRQTRAHDPSMIIECARQHGAELRRRQDQRAKGAGAMLVKRPNNWLREGDWQGYIPKVEEIAAQDALIVTALGNVRRALGEGVFKLLRDQGMPDAALAKLDGIGLEQPATFTITSSYQRILLEKHDAKIERLLNERPRYVVVPKAATG